MKKSTNILFGIVLILSGIISSCKRDTYEPYYGTQACPDDNFGITTAFALNKTSDQTVNFQTTDSLHFTAVFTSNARWKIIIKGVSSNASLTLEGFSSSIDTAWYGRSGSNLFFENEKVTIEFNIVCKPELTTNFSVTIIKPDFNNDPKVKLLTNFNSANSVFPSNWIYYLDSDPLYGSGMADTVWCTSSSTCSNYMASQEGGGYLSFIGQKPIPQGDSKNVYGTYEVYPPSLSSLPSDPNLVWFNFLANTEGIPMKVIVTFKHWDGAKGFGRKVLTINTSKWEMQSIPLGKLEKGPTDELTFNSQDTGIVIMTVIQSGGIAPTIFNIDIPNFTIGSSFYGTNK